MGESKAPSAGISRGSRLLALDAIKGIAILLVIWGHIHISMAPDYQSLNYSYVVQYLQAVHMPLFIRGGERSVHNDTSAQYPLNR